MSETQKTLSFAGVAAVMLVAALLAAPRYTPPRELTDLGVFFEDFKDPTKATALQVVDYQEETGSATIFKVELKGKSYVIPSHQDYPADAATRLPDTAALAVDLKKDVFRSSREKDHEELGVIDPLDEGGASLKGRGQRVTLWEGDKILADYIFGKETEDGKRFVRVPGDNRTYAVRMKGEITAKFEDWIETDLLKVSQYAIRGIEIDHYTMEVSQRNPFERPRVNILNETNHVLARKTSSDPWTLNGLKETEEVNTDTITGMLSALDDMKIVDVRKKPESLIRSLRATGDFTIDPQRVTPDERQALMSLAQKGYQLLGERRKDPKTGQDTVVLRLRSEKGQIEVRCDDGIVYTLRFGESRVAAAEEKKEEKEGEKKEEGGDKMIAGEAQRFLFVTARFEEAALGEAPVKPVAPAGVTPDGEKKEEKKDGEKKEGEEPKKDEAKQEESPEVKKYKEDLAEFERKSKDRAKKIEDGKKRAKELTDRFADWYYVISGDLFTKLQVDRSKLVKPKEKKEEGKPGADPHDHEKK